MATMKNGTRVNVTLGNGDVIPGTISKAFKNNKYKVTCDDETKSGTFDAAHVAERKAGRRPLAQTMTAKELASEVDGLLEQLGKAKNEDDKKRLRRLLRRRGHQGGLGIREAKGE